MTGREWFGYGVAAILIAAAVHFGTLFALPHFVMNRVLARMGTVNTMHYGKRPDAAARGVVRPSPDLLYAVCPFDLTDGAVRVHAPVPRDTYWSIALYDTETNNFYVKNDRQAKGGSVDLVIAYDTAAVENDIDKSPELVNSPSRRGLVLIRTLISDEDDLPALLAAEHQAKCVSTALGGAPGSARSGG